METRIFRSPKVNAICYGSQGSEWTTPFYGDFPLLVRHEVAMSPGPALSPVEACPEPFDKLRTGLSKGRRRTPHNNGAPRLFMKSRSRSTFAR
jgi:hypothetical protein